MGEGELKMIKVFVLTLILLIFSVNTVYCDIILRKSFTSNDKFDIYKNNERTGYIRRDFVFPNRWNIYDTKGERKGTLRPSYPSSNNFRMEDINK